MRGPRKNPRPRRKRVGVDFAPSDLAAGWKLSRPRTGPEFLIVSVTNERIIARMRRTNRGRWSDKLYEIVPAEVLGFAIEVPDA